MNKNKLNLMVRKVSEEKGILFNSVLSYYFMEDILIKISKSRYKDNFIFKGGFLLSNIVGISLRATMDMDFLLKNAQLSKENVEKIFCEILTNEDKVINYQIESIKSIREKDFYGGLRVMLLARFENIQQHVPIDIATGDIITPQPINYNYKSIFGNSTISVKAYPVETILAEKIETMYSRGFLNSRSKDYFDIYLIWKLHKSNIEKKVLNEAINKTFSYRNTEYNVKKLKNLINQLNLNHNFISRWDNYRKKNDYVGNITLEEVFETILELLDSLE